MSVSCRIKMQINSTTVRTTVGNIMLSQVRCDKLCIHANDSAIRLCMSEIKIQNSATLDVEHLSDTAYLQCLWLGKHQVCLWMMPIMHTSTCSTCTDTAAAYIARPQKSNSNRLSSSARPTKSCARHCVCSLVGPSLLNTAQAPGRFVPLCYSSLISLVCLQATPLSQAASASPPFQHV